MGVNSLPKTVTRQRRDCDLNPGSSAPESSTPTTWPQSHPTSAEMHAKGLLGSAKPGHIEPRDRFAAKNTDYGYQGEECPR